jgi:tripartite-type tricarboxylate transporter receptor subunit TctC
MLRREEAFPMTIPRIAAASLFALATVGATAQTYPDKTVRLVVPSSAGSGPDVLARTVGAKLAERWGQPVVVENKAGASTIVGNDFVAKSAPDGYTLSVTPHSVAITPALYKNIPYDPVKDLAPVSQLATAGMVLVVHPSVPVKNVAEFVAYVKERPGKLNYGSAGAGTTHHIMMELFKYVSGTDMVHVPYKGPGPIMPDLLSGQISTAFISLHTAMPHIQSGKLRALAVAGDRRSPIAPDIPTVADAGYKAFDPELWYGVLAPAGTPPEVVRKLNADIVAVLNTPEVKEQLAKQGFDAAPTTPEGLGNIIKSDVTRYKKLVADTGMKAE